MPSLQAPRRARTRTRRREQLELWSGSPEESAGQPDLLPTRVLLRHRSCSRVLELIRQVRTFYPELDGITIRVGLTRTAAGLAAREQPWIWINPRKLTRHTIAHELIHLLQSRGLVPSGEKSADLHALARHPLLADDLPYYLKTPRALRNSPPERRGRVHLLLHALARASLARRESGERNYLRWFEDELARQWKQTLDRAVAPPAEVAEQADLF